MTFESMTVAMLFSTPLIRWQVPDFATLNPTLLKEGHKMRSQTEGVTKSNQGGWHSSGNIFASDTECFQQLLSSVRDAVYAATSRMSDEVDTKTLRMKLSGWMNINPQGSYNAPHTHPGAHWSGVYYVAQPEVEEGMSGMIEFLDPRSDLPNWRMLKSVAFQQKFKIRPQPGDLILFPSFLVHWVFPNEADSERVSIAFNATFEDPDG
ncbi:conserved hypothetical protein [Cognatiyoonia koreensis]|uniref:Uncharacterized protein n=1 Tax=Cognatiyoonia koreensis TaxID=364200 RepID=A0A1I0RWC0_9RHOB|nr:TIGR02466 family protein [Cognatiyoonia koreensis]SEW45782.1 conserved hypothetical protein [Cognatiyoonia koreensis]